MISYSQASRWGGSAMVLLTLSIGLIASYSFAVTGIWLAPPLLAYTVLLHGVLALAWLPVLIGCVIGGRISGRQSLLLFLGGGLLTFAYLFCLMAPYFAHIILLDEANCQQSPLPNNQVCYTCLSSIDPSTQQMKGSAGSVLVRLLFYPEVCPITK